MNRVAYRDRLEFARFDTQQQLRPALFRFPIAVFNGDKFFPSVFRDVPRTATVAAISSSLMTLDR